MPRVIPLTQNRQTLVDDDLYEQLRQYRWRYHKRGYAVRSARRAMVLMHRQILNAPPGTLVDHINGDPLDNRRENLRLVTPTQNQRNRQQRKNKTGYKGVTQSGRRYLARITVSGKRVHLGYHDSAIVASFIYDHAARRFFGPHARLNHPDMPQMLDYDARLDQILAGTQPKKVPVRTRKPRVPRAPSPYRGVYWERGRWRAAITRDRRKIHLGYFLDAQAAADAYRRAQAADPGGERFAAHGC